MPADDPPLLPAPERPLLLPPPGPTGWRRRPQLWLALALAALVLIAFLIGFFVHHAHAKAAEEAAERRENQLPLVTAVRPSRSAKLSELLLPGTLTPLEDAAIFARSTGYVLSRKVDIGDDVKAGQVLAVIDSPDLDQEVAAAQANVAQARQQRNQAVANVADAQAKRDDALVHLQRYEELLKSDSIARQDVDTQRQVYESSEAALRSAIAGVSAADEAVRAAVAEQRRVTVLAHYEQVRAPFDGVITARNATEGALITGAGASMVGSTNGASPTGTSTGGSSTGTTSSSGSTGSSSGGGSGNGGSTSASGTGLEMFHIARVEQLRVYVNVPQESASLVQPGAPAAVLVREAPRLIVGTVVRTSRALDPSSRTLLVEVRIPNPARKLLPGMFADVRFTDPRPTAPLMLSGETLITRAEGTMVAVLEPLFAGQRQAIHDESAARCARTVRLQMVGLGRDYGTQVEITQGLKGGEFVVLNPGDMVTPGAALLPALQDPAAQAGGGGTGGSGQGDAKDQNKDKDKDKGKDAASANKDKHGGNASDSTADTDDPRRRQAEQHCLEEQAAAAQARMAASAASGAQSGTPSDTRPAGITSPSIVAPTQGQRKGGSSQR